MASEQTVLALIRAWRPSFRNRADKVAFAVHATYAAAGYVLHAVGPVAFADHALYFTGTDEVGIDNWNDVEEKYAFVYSSPEWRPKKVLVRCSVITGHLIIDVLKEHESMPLFHVLVVSDYVNENGGTTYGSQYKNLGKLVADVNKIISSRRDGSRSPSLTSSPPRFETSWRDDIYQPTTTETIYLNDPYDIPPPTWFEKSLGDDRCRPTPMKIICPEDPFIPPSTGFVVPRIPAYGGSDLFPGPGAGMYPTRGDNGRGSMLVGPRDPMFFGGGIGEPGSLGGLRGVPPGARFDPYGPPEVPGFEPDRFESPSWHDGGADHPDLEHFHNGGDFFM